MKHQEAIDIVTQSLDDLHAALKSGRNDIFEQALTLAAKFHKYSYRNLMMIYKQCPEASVVAGYHAWRKHKRWVRAGEAGIAIFAPVTRRKEQQTDERNSMPNDLNSESRLTGFRLVHVFDLSQTDGEELIEESPIDGNPGRNLNALIGVFRDLKIKVVFTKLPGTVQGYSLGGEVRIREDLDDSSLFRVLVHELAHEMMHKSIPASANRKSIVETEAEAVAFVVSTACGISCLDRSADYIALSDGNADLLGESISKIHQTSSSIIRRIEDRVVLLDQQSVFAA